MSETSRFLSPLALVPRGEGLGVRGFSSVIRLAMLKDLFLEKHDSASLVNRSYHPLPTPRLLGRGELGGSNSYLPQNLLLQRIQQPNSLANIRLLALSIMGNFPFNRQRSGVAQFEQRAEIRFHPDIAVTQRHFGTP